MITRNEYIDQFLRNKEREKPKKSTERWDYLYDYEKVKQAKLSEKRLLNKKNEEEKEFSHCTFSPKLNRIRKTQATELKLGDRVQYYEQKKNLKIGQIQKSKEEKEVEECIFKPHLNPSYTNLSKSKIDLHETTQDLIQNPDSYNKYLRRINDLRKQQESRVEREKNTPGSGNLWKNKLTVPKGFQLGLKSKEHYSNRNLNDSRVNKSFNRPMSSKKIMNTYNTQNNIKVHSPLREEDIGRMIFNERRETFNDFQEDHKDFETVKITEPMEYSQALRYLHAELNSMVI